MSKSIGVAFQLFYLFIHILAKRAQRIQILDHASSDFKLRILESLYIYKKKPKLNYMSSAMPLLVIKYICFCIHDTEYLYIRLIALYIY